MLGAKAARAHALLLLRNGKQLSPGLQSLTHHLAPPPLPAAAPAGDDGRSWQPYADHLVYTALMALPWGGPELAESVPEAVADLLAAAEAYMGKRPRSTQPSLRPYSAAVREDDPAAE